MLTFGHGGAVVERCNNPNIPFRRLNPDQGGVFGFLAGIIALLLLQLSVESKLDRVPKPVLPHSESVEVTSRINPDLFRALTFGHWMSGADWLWIKTLLDGSIEHVAKGRHPQIYYDLDLLSDLDPAYFDVYVSGAHLLSVVRDDGPGARDLLLKGEEFRKGSMGKYPEAFRVRYWSNAWLVPLTLAYVQLFELGDLPMAARSFVEASVLPGAPHYLDSLARRLLRPGGQYEVGLRLIRFMIDGQSDPHLRNELEQKERSLIVGQFLDQAERSFSAFRAGLAGRSGPPHPDSVRYRDLWRQFLAQTGMPNRDPFGGEVRLDEQGKIVTTTPHQSVFGLR